MVNAEKYRDLIIEIFKTEGMNIGILNNTPYPCALLECSQCGIWKPGGTKSECSMNFIKWMTEEVTPDYRISQDLKEEICFKLLIFNEENYIKVNELIRDAKIIK